MGPKRASDADLDTANKFPKLEEGIATPAATPLAARQPPSNNDFSGSVKKKLASSTRTGQACDRCKVRKIRCDGRPDGCSPCAQNRTPCKTTDRITGRATTRGHTEAMEAENNYLRSQIAELQAQVRELGAEPRVVPGYSAFPTPGVSWQLTNTGSDGQGWSDASPRQTSSSPLPGYAPANKLATGESMSLPQFKMKSVGDNYLGVSSAVSLLSHIKGTSLSLFGTEINITDFVKEGEDYDKSVMSYNHFLKVALREHSQIKQLPFPEYSRLSEYANWYLRSLNPYTMLLDRPSFMNLIWRIGNEPQFTPSPADTVCVHMMLSTIKYQISVRNDENALEGLMKESHEHYVYSLSFFKDLLLGHTWKDLQALTMIALHMRNFPKPGAAWIMCSTTFLLAIELGLHRSVKAWAESAGTMDKLEIESRKRIFWTLHALSTNLSGKLGRPMPINICDIDVEFPEATTDCLPGEVDPNPFRKCSFQVGIQTAKYTVWSSELYRNIYAVRQTPQGYDTALRRLEDGIRQWKLEIPNEISDPRRAAQEDYIFALFLEHWDQEFQLLLHHPAVCRSTDPEVINSNLDKCLATSQKLLRNCNEMRKIRSLDIPWINTVVYLAAIFTTLFIHFQRKDQMSVADMTKLKDDMDQWVIVMGECGQLLGSGDKLKDAVQKMIEQQLISIHDSVVKRTTTEELARAALQTPQAASVYANGSAYEPYSGPNVTASDPTLTPASTSFTSVASGSQYPYNSTASDSVAPQQSVPAYEQQSYRTEDTGMPASDAAALAAAASGAPTRSNDTYTYSIPQSANNDHQHPYTANSVLPQDWRQWSRNIYIQPVPAAGEYLNTANTLMTLGGRQGSVDTPGADGTNVDIPAGSSNFWPDIAFRSA